MYFLPIILAALLGVATSGLVPGGLTETIVSAANISPENYVGIKEMIFNIINTRTPKKSDILESFRTTDISSRNPLIENLLRELLEELRVLMVNGADGVPILDPFEMDEMHLDGNLVDIPNSHLTIRDIKVSNLSTFEVDLSVTLTNPILLRYRLDLDARVPVLDAEAGNYDISLQIWGGHIFGIGNAKIKIVNPRVYGSVVAGPRPSISGIFLRVRSCQLHLALDAFEVQITGLFDNEVASEFVSSFLSSLIPEMAEYFKEDISEAISNAVLEIANNILEDLNVTDLLP